VRRRECHSAAKSGSREEVLREHDRFHLSGRYAGAGALCIGIAPASDSGACESNGRLECTGERFNRRGEGQNALKDFA
jgi:hypothetical protein